MRTVLAVGITTVCLVILLELQSPEAADEVKGPKVTEKVTMLYMAVICWIKFYNEAYY